MVTLQQLKNAVRSALSYTDVKVNKTKDSITELVDNIPQSSWNQNDETAKDFIQGRTHYEYIAPKILLEKQEIANNTNISLEHYESKLIFIIDDVEYKCIRKEQDRGQYRVWWYGNGSLHDSSLQSSSEPFSFTGKFHFSDGNAHIVEILSEELSVYYKTLDESFIPDSIARVGYIPDGTLLYNEQSLEETQQMQARKNMDLYYSDAELLYSNSSANFYRSSSDHTLYIDKYYTINLENGKLYRLVVNGELLYGICEIDKNTNLNMTIFYNAFSGKESTVQYFDGHLQIYDSNNIHNEALIRNIALYEVLDYETIPDLFIPDSIARKSDLESVSGGPDITIDTEMSDESENPVQNKVMKAYIDAKVVQPDWNEEDETSPAFIHNKPKTLEVSMISYNGILYILPKDTKTYGFTETDYLEKSVSYDDLVNAFILGDVVFSAIYSMFTRYEKLLSIGDIANRENYGEYSVVYISSLDGTITFKTVRCKPNGPAEVNTSTSTSTTTTNP